MINRGVIESIIIDDKKEAVINQEFMSNKSRNRALQTDSPRDLIGSGLALGGSISGPYNSLQKLLYACLLPTKNQDIYKINGLARTEFDLKRQIIVERLGIREILVAMLARASDNDDAKELLTIIPVLKKFEEDLFSFIDAESMEMIGLARGVQGDSLERYYGPEDRFENSKGECKSSSESGTVDDMQFGERTSSDESESGHVNDMEFENSDESESGSVFLPNVRIRMDNPMNSWGAFDLNSDTEDEGLNDDESSDLNLEDSSEADSDLNSDTEDEGLNDDESSDLRSEESTEVASDLNVDSEDEGTDDMVSDSNSEESTEAKNEVDSDLNSASKDNEFARQKSATESASEKQKNNAADSGADSGCDAKSACSSDKSDKPYRCQRNPKTIEELRFFEKYLLR